MRASRFAMSLSCLALITAPRAASAKSFVTIRDDGVMTKVSPSTFTRRFVPLYDATGKARPEVLSVWTAFPMDGEPHRTLFASVANDVSGIGLENEIGGGMKKSFAPPLRAILLHNDFTELATRAALSKSPLDGFGQYLFLLELSHLWGPAVRVNETGSGGKADALIGFPFHWSFWLDAGSSPAGGNPWHDNGDGTFTVSGQTPTSVRFSTLDLYLMGLADPSEVKPFGVLENAVAPPSFKDPYTRRGLDAASFPYWGSAPLTVTATRRTVSIDEVVAVNGARSPARAEAKLTLGVVLMVPKDATDEAILDLEKEFEPLAASLAPSFGAATSGRGQMELLTAEASTPAEGGVPTAATPSTDATQTTGPSGDSGCTAVPSRMTPPWFSALAVMGLLALGRRLRHAQARRTSERHSETVAASKGLESTMGARVPSSRRATSVSGAPVIRTTVASRPGQRAATSR